MTKEEFDKKVEELNLEKTYNSMRGEINRSRSVTVGTAFGGTTELSMRGDNGQNLWCVMQPVEVVELINQLAANVGCHVALKPREDFASWRVWNLTAEEYRQLNGHPPFVNDMAPFNQLGASGVDNNTIAHIIKSGANGTDGGLGGAGGAINSATCGLSSQDSAKFKSMDIEDQIIFASQLEKADIERQKGLQNETVATKKSANKRTAKRIAASS